MHHVQCTRSAGVLYAMYMYMYMYMYSVFFRNFFQGGQTNIFRNRGGRRLQLKCIKLKLAKSQGGGEMPPLNPPRKNPEYMLVEERESVSVFAQYERRGGGGGGEGERERGRERNKDKKGARERGRGERKRERETYASTQSGDTR